MPYLPILDILRSYFDIQEEDREVHYQEKGTERLLELDEKLFGCPPSLQELLSLTVEDEKYLQIDPQQRRERTFEAIRDLLDSRESNGSPWSLLLEDLHWIDKTSQEFLDYLIGGLAQDPNPVGSSLPAGIHPHLGEQILLHPDRPGSTIHPESAELVQTILKGGRSRPELRELILGKAGGNPLFVEELTHSLAGERLYPY